MANTITRFKKYVPLLDEVYKYSSRSAILDNPNVQFIGGNAVKVFKTSMDGLGDYSRNNSEFAAKSIAYLVCARNHIVPEGVSVPASYSNQEAKALKAQLGQIRDVANTMHNTMENVLGKQKSQDHTQSRPANPKNRDAR